MNLRGIKNNMKTIKQHILERLVLSKTGNKTPFQKICENPVYSVEVKHDPYNELYDALLKYVSNVQPVYDLDVLYGDDLPVIEYVKGSFYNVVALYLDSKKKNIEFKLENSQGDIYGYLCLSSQTLCNVLGNWDKECGKAVIEWIINDILESI
jgi:hypothetical protein